MSIRNAAGVVCKFLLGDINDVCVVLFLWETVDSDVPRGIVVVDSNS